MCHHYYYHYRFYYCGTYDYGPKEGGDGPCLTSFPLVQHADKHRAEEWGVAAVLLPLYARRCNPPRGAYSKTHAPAVFRELVVLYFVQARIATAAQHNTRKYRSEHRPTHNWATLARCSTRGQARHRPRGVAV